jgi:hypothetical protein
VHSLGEVEPIKQPDHFFIDYVDGPDLPIAVFNFRYRSRNDLKAECIIPRSPTPIPLEDRSIEDLTMEEARELLRRQKVLISSLLIYGAKVTS